MSLFGALRRRSLLASAILLIVSALAATVVPTPARGVVPMAPCRSARLRFRVRRPVSRIRCSCKPLAAHSPTAGA